jgi:Holliday junction resolvase RusA-like endonuclease
MKNVLHLEIEGRPFSMDKPHAKIVKRKEDGKDIPLQFWPDSYNEWCVAVQKAVQVARHKAGISRRLNGFIRLTAVFYWPRPKSHFGTDGVTLKDSCKTELPQYDNKILCNLLKALFHALQGRAINNQNQIVALGDVRFLYDYRGRIEAMLEEVDASDIDERAIGILQQQELDLL